MSGGRFDYNQYRIGEIADAIESVIAANGKTRNQLHEEDYHGRGGLVDQIRDIYIDWIDPNGWRGWKASWDGTYESHKKYVEDHNNEKLIDYSKKTIKEFEKAVDILRKAQVYAQRIDWLLSGDDGEESFHSRLKEELEKLKKTDGGK